MWWRRSSGTGPDEGSRQHRPIVLRPATVRQPPHTGLSLTHNLVPQRIHWARQPVWPGARNHWCTRFTLLSLRGEQEEDVAPSLRLQQAFGFLLLADPFFFFLLSLLLFLSFNDGACHFLHDEILHVRAFPSAPLSFSIPPLLVLSLSEEAGSILLHWLLKLFDLFLK